MSAVAALRRYRVIRPFLHRDTFPTELPRTEGRSSGQCAGGFGAIGNSDWRAWREGPTGQSHPKAFDLAGPGHRRTGSWEATPFDGDRPSQGDAGRRTAREPPPSYAQVRAVGARLSPGLLVLAHEGSKAYCDTFDLLHRREAERPNAIWQADHSEVDVLVKDDEGKPRKPWLTIVLDDYSRAVAGYLLFFGAPSAIQTALALRQAIWRKSQPGWHICGIPQVLYTDHGSDFTSQHLEQVAADLKIRLIFSTAGSRAAGARSSGSFSR